jgi:hypothetical protein
MIMPSQPPSQVISSTSMYSSLSKSHGGDDKSNRRWDEQDNDPKIMPKRETGNRSEIMHRTNNENGFSNGDSRHHNAYNYQDVIPVTNNGNNRRASGGTYQMHSDHAEPDERMTQHQHQQQHQGVGRQALPLDDSDEIQQDQQQEDADAINHHSMLKEPLHKTLYGEFDNKLTSLREATIEALQLSCQEQERLCLQGEELEARIAYMREKIELAKFQLLERGGVEDDFRLNLVRDTGDGRTRTSGSGLQTLDENSQATTEKGDETPMMRISASRGMPLHNNRQTSSKRFSISRGAGSLHGSQTTQFSKGSNASDGTAMPHMSRSSLLGMLGASKNWLDNYSSSNSNSSNNNNLVGGNNINNTALDIIEDDESGIGSTASASFRMSFMDGVGDSMPSRWRAREQEREKSDKKKEEEERRLREKTTNDNERNDVDVVPVLRSVGGGSGGIGGSGGPRKERTKEEQLQYLISKREGQISFLEERAASVEQQTSALRDEISTLENDQRQTQDDYEQERDTLLDEIDQVEFDNERLDHMLVETGVSLEEKKIMIEIFAHELKGARQELANVQNEQDRRRAERKQRERSRRWSSSMNWVRSSTSSLLSSNDADPKQEQQQQERPPHSSPGQGRQGSGVHRYQVPTDVMQQYRTLVNSSDEDTNDGNDIGEHDRGKLDRRQSHASVGTCMSALTMDSGELVDILELLELDDL